MAITDIDTDGVDTPRKGGAAVSRHAFVMHRLAFGLSNPKTGRDFGRRPRQPAGNVLATRALVPAPKTSADARRPRRCQGPSLVTQDTPTDRESGPIPGGWAGPTNPLGDRLPAGRVKMFLLYFPMSCTPAEFTLGHLHYQLFSDALMLLCNTTEICVVQWRMLRYVSVDDISMGVSFDTGHASESCE